MTERQRLFAAEYLIDLNATKAAVRAGYSPKSAVANGARLLKNPKIEKEIQSLMVKREKKIGISQDEVLRELARIAFSNYADYVEIVSRQESQEVWNEETQQNEQVVCEIKSLEARPTQGLNAGQQRAIRNIKAGKDGIRVEVYDKMKALELLGKHLGMFKDRFEMPEDEQGRKSLAEAIEEAYNKRMGRKSGEGEP